MREKTIGVTQLQRRFREVFDDREAFPDGHFAIDQHGALTGRTEALDARLRVCLPERDNRLLECEAQLAHENPWPERPRRVELIGDDELQRHLGSPAGAFGAVSPGLASGSGGIARGGVSGA